MLTCLINYNTTNSKDACLSGNWGALTCLINYNRMSTDYKEQINELKDSLRIEDVIGAYVHLEHKAGGKCLGICPFHDDSHPSMSVHKGKQIFKCFSTGKGGTAITFLMEIEGFTYPEALRHAAKKYGIEVEEDKREFSEEQKNQQTERDILTCDERYSATSDKIGVVSRG